VLSDPVGIVRLRNRFGWTFEGAPPPPVIEDASTLELQITFVMPSAREPEPPPIDVTPSPYDAKPADLSKPALPPPPERRRGPLDWLEEPGQGGLDAVEPVAIICRYENASSLRKCPIHRGF
jgi:hypothetical protein